MSVDMVTTGWTGKGGNVRDDYSEGNLAEGVDGRVAQHYISSKLEEIEYQVGKFPPKQLNSRAPSRSFGIPRRCHSNFA